jgi:glutathione S-transferase
MKLIGTQESPYTRKVRIVLAEKRIDYDFVNDAPASATTQVPRYNPLGKVPVLIIDDETTVFDSRVIVEYLDQASPVSKLIPEDTSPRPGSPVGGAGRRLHRCDRRHRDGATAPRKHAVQ